MRVLAFRDQQHQLASVAFIPVFAPLFHLCHHINDLQLQAIVPHMLMNPRYGPGATKTSRATKSTQTWRIGALNRNRVLDGVKLYTIAGTVTPQTSGLTMRILRSAVIRMSLLRTAATHITMIHTALLFILASVGTLASTPLLRLHLESG